MPLVLLSPQPSGNFKKFQACAQRWRTFSVADQNAGEHNLELSKVLGGATKASAYEHQQRQPREASGRFHGFPGGREIHSVKLRP
jgi:hypothetical protein